jgi:NADPH:quinone reductase-like Zn-dependent oxidoreductase
LLAATFAEYGPPEKLTVGEMPRPTPGAGELLVRVAAAGLNPIDCRIRSGELRLILRVGLPFVCGSDIAGIVEEAGPGANRFRPGDAVFAMLPIKAGGGYAEYALVREAMAAPAPAGITLAEAASVPLAALTAVQLLRDKAGVVDGCEVLIYGASGGVGSFAVQVAKLFGGRVTAAASGRNAEFIRALGADEVVDYTQGIDHLGPRFDVVFDAVDKLPFRRSRRLLRPQGVVVTTNPVAQWLALNFLAFLRAGRRLRSVLVEPRGTDLELLGVWIAGGQVRPHIDRSFSLAEAVDAQRLSETGRVRGKLVLIVDEPLAGQRPPFAS